MFISLEDVIMRLKEDEIPLNYRDNLIVLYAPITLEESMFASNLLAAVQWGPNIHISDFKINNVLDVKLFVLNYK